MNRQQKEDLVGTLKQQFGASSAAYVVGYKGLPVSALQKLRKDLRNKGGSFKVVKMRLLKRALDTKELDPYFKEQRAVVFATQEPTAIAKTLQQFAEQNEKFEIVGGYFEHEVCDKETVRFIATLPAREVLLAQLVGTMQAPISRCVGLLNIMMSRLVIVLAQIAEKKQKES